MSHKEKLELDCSETAYRFPIQLIGSALRVYEQ